MKDTRYRATWRWNETGKKESLTYNEEGAPAALRALRRAVAEGRATKAKLTARTVIYDSEAGIDTPPGTLPLTADVEPGGRVILKDADGRRLPRSYSRGEQGWDGS